jgi:hypothetical protein
VWAASATARSSTETDENKGDQMVLSRLIIEADVPALGTAKVKTRHFLSHLHTKMIVLPRQARDKRRGDSKTRRVFLQYILRAATASSGKKNVAVSKVEVGDNKTGFTLTSPKITVTVSAKGLLDSAQHAGSTAPPLPLRQDLMLYWGNGKEKHFLRHLNLKIIVLPRQARDKHRENSKTDLFLGSILRLPANGSITLIASNPLAWNRTTTLSFRVYSTTPGQKTHLLCHV